VSTKKFKKISKPVHNFLPLIVLSKNTNLAYTLIGFSYQLQLDLMAKLRYVIRRKFKNKNTYNLSTGQNPNNRRSMLPNRQQERSVKGQSDKRYIFF
jgi:hypothetical protein